MLQLVRLPFTEVKVDKSFVMTALRSPESQAVVISIVELGHSLGLKATAEGVEDQPTLEHRRLNQRKRRILVGPGEFSYLLDVLLRRYPMG